MNKANKMNADELEKYFLDQLSNGECYLIVGKGKASYKMRRGSFKTRDTIIDRRKLHFIYKDENRYTFSDGKVQAVISIDKDPFVKFHFHVDSGYNRFTLRLHTFEDEKIYGCGEQYTHLDLKGKDVPIWVSEHQRVSKIIKKFLREKLHGVNPDYQAPYKDHQTYYSSPSFFSSKNYFIYCHEDTYGVLCFHKDEVLIKFRQVPQSISLLTADNPLELSQKVTALVGHQPKLPSWVGNGVILAIQGGSEVLKKKYQEAKDKGIKVAAVWCQDWSGHVVTEFGYQVYWNWKADEKLYPGLKDIIRDLNKDGVRFLGYINTFLKEGVSQYEEAKKKGFLVRRKCGTVYLVKSTTFNAGIVDLTNPAAYEWYKNIIKKNMIEYGLSGWMADFGEYLPTDCVVYGGIPEKLHNRWPSMWAKCCYEAVRECQKEDEIFYFSRAAYGHTIQYTNSMWNGDQHVDFSDEYGLGSIIPAIDSMACSGVGVIHSDIGGYTTILHMKRSAELFNRWSEMNLFTPVYRTHEGNRPKSNVQFDCPSVIDEFAANSKIFLALKPYRDYVLNEYYTRGTPVNTPLFFYSDEEEAYLNKREFMFGKDVLVSPILRPNEIKHHYYLPEGEWKQMFTEAEFGGGEGEISSPPGLPLAFYKKDSQFASLFSSLKSYFTKGEK
jgi:alpha-glucosidase